MVRKSLLVLAAVWGMTLAGCQIYIDSPDPPPNGGGGPTVPAPGGPGVPGSECGTHADCMMGCFCSDKGLCEEAGFCELDWDCPLDFVCERERFTCIPDVEPEPCRTDDACPFGMYCDAKFGECVDSQLCQDDLECSLGFACDERGTCVPASCKVDVDCFEGSYCDQLSGECIDTGLCDDQSQCLEGMECDDRNTCVPSKPGCFGKIDEAACAIEAPNCPSDMTPEIAAGCYTGECTPIDSCELPDIETCSDIDTIEDAGFLADVACKAHPECSPVYTGINCTCDGVACLCDAADANCVCESYEYANCAALPSETPVVE